METFQRCPLLFSILSQRIDDERGLRQRVTCVLVGSQSVNRRRESVDAQIPDGQTTERTIDVLENVAPVALWGAFLQNPYKAITMSFIRLDPELQTLAKYGKRVPSNRDLEETEDTSRVGKVSSIQVITRHPFSHEAQVIRIFEKQQSGIFVRRTVRKQLGGTDDSC